MVFHQGPRGAQGNQGNRGEQGATGLSIPVRRAVVFLFALAALLGGLSLFWTAHEVHASQAASRAATQAEVRALCTTFTKLAALQPPAGNPATNPSRAYLQGQHDTLDQLGTDLGCK
jgi:Na+-driven multidrug efflux pump